MTYIIHRLAERDLEEAFQNYRKKAGDKVALRFLAEFEQIAALLDVNPGLGTRTEDERRIHPFPKLPYWVCYKSIDTGIRILVVRHKRRHEGFGASRS
jgi:plasmid stabilization system protein ParE